MSKVIIRHEYEELKDKDKKTITTTDYNCNIGINKIGDVYFVIEKIEKESIKIRIADDHEIPSYENEDFRNGEFILEKRKLFGLNKKIKDLEIGNYIDFKNGKDDSLRLRDKIAVMEITYIK